MTPLTNDHEPSAANHREKTRAIAPGTGGKIIRIVAVIVIGLGVGFFFVHRAKNDAEARLVEATGKETTEAPAVNVFTITPSPGTQSLKLPGETAAWNETAIYARVNGYVAKWFADIGDNVSAVRRSTSACCSITWACAALSSASASALPAFFDSRSWSDTTPLGDSRQR